MGCCRSVTAARIANRIEYRPCLELYQQQDQILTIATMLAQTMNSKISLRGAPLAAKPQTAQKPAARSVTVVAQVCLPRCAGVSAYNSCDLLS